MAIKFKTAYIDESNRPGGKYLLCGASVTTAVKTSLCKDLQALVKPGQRRIHFVDENDSRKKKVLDVIAQHEIENYLWTAKGFNQVKAREAIFWEMVPELHTLGVSQLVIESSDGQDARDRKIISEILRQKKIRIKYGHSKPYEETCLWIPDAIAWTYGRDKLWRKELTSRQLITEKYDIQA